MASINTTTDSKCMRAKVIAACCSRPICVCPPPRRAAESAAAADGESKAHVTGDPWHVGSTLAHMHFESPVEKWKVFPVLRFLSSATRFLGDLGNPLWVSVSTTTVAGQISPIAKYLPRAVGKNTKFRTDSGWIRRKSGRKPEFSRHSDRTQSPNRPRRKSTGKGAKTKQQPARNRNEPHHRKNERPTATGKPKTRGDLQPSQRPNAKRGRHTTPASQHQPTERPEPCLGSFTGRRCGFEPPLHHQAASS